MPINVATSTTKPRSELPSAVTERGVVPLFAILPVFPEDFLQGGCSINSTGIPVAADGKKWAYRGDVFRRNAGTGLWDLLSETTTPTDNGQQCVMLPHDLDCTEQGQSFNGVLRSPHVHQGVLTRDIPAFLLGPNKQFQFKYRSPVILD